MCSCDAVYAQRVHYQHNDTRCVDIIASVVSDENTAVLCMYEFTGGRLMLDRHMRLSESHDDIEIYELGHLLSSLRRPNDVFTVQNRSLLWYCLHISVDVRFTSASSTASATL